MFQGKEMRQMVYEFHGKAIKIPDAEIQTSIEVLGITQAEAVQMWLEDHDYLENEEIEELTAKAKENRTYIKDDSAKESKRGKRERKPNDEKRALIALLHEALVAQYSDAVITNPEKVVDFTLNGNHYSVTLTCHRAPKA